VDVTLHGGAAGFASVDEAGRIRLPVAKDETRPLENAGAHPFAGLIFLVPGIQDTLRVNGSATAVRDADGDALELAVHETFLHCPKAFIRSHLWAPAAWRADVPAVRERVGDRLDADDRAFLARSPFWFLATCLEDGHADVSPRGDPPGAVHALDERTLLVPDRPGNRLLDNYRNVLANPRAGLLFVVPGESAVLRVTGEASLTTDPALLAPMTVQGKTPLLALRLAITELATQHCDAFARARAWDASAQIPRKTLPSLARMVIDQIQPDRPVLLNAALARVFDVVFDRDAKKNLY
jgi:hypothetical protein